MSILRYNIPPVFLFFFPFLLPAQEATLLESKRLLGQSVGYSISFSPDGKLVAGGGWGTVVIWSVESGKEIRRVFGHGKQVHAVAFSPDGKLLASGGEDETIKIWSTEAWQELRSLASHSGPILDLEFSHDGSFLASAMKGRPVRPNLTEAEQDKERGQTVRILSTQTWGEMKSPIAYNGRLADIAFSPNGKLLAGCGGHKNNAIRIWSVDTGREAKKFSKPSSTVSFSPDGKFLASSTNVGTISIWSVEEGIEVRRLSDAGDYFPSVVRFSPDGSLLASANFEGKIRKGYSTITLWSTESWRNVVTAKQSSQFVVLDLSFSPDGKGMASITGQTDWVTLWSVKPEVLLSDRSSNRSLVISSSGATRNREDDSVSAPPAQVWAVVVGISRYGRPDLRLQYADRDAQAFFDFLRSPRGGGLPADRIALLLNEEATRENIIKSINDKLNRAFEEDMVIIYVACHGMPDPVGSEVYFLGFDGKPENLAGTAVSQLDIEKALTRTRAKRKLWITDACHSGGAGLAVRGNYAYLTNKLLSEIAASKEGLAMLTASSASEFSQENERWGGGHGVFTYFLLRGLTGEADADGDGVVNVREVYEYVYRGVAEETHGQQHPELKGTFDNKLPISIVK